ncbi:MAG TPA: polysaccharide biosynthesis protein GumN [Rhizobiales bacterium]|nr:polysaccharide biosynthesis protein GumN [Hyphomicrobiales bacterium]
MNRAVFLADRLALPALKLLAAINVIFFLSFLLVAALAVEQAQAETPACKGVDLMEALKKEDPDAARKIEEEARATPNGSGLLWRIEKAGLTTSFLFGTMHMTDARVTTLPPAAQAAYDASSTVVIETTDVLDQAGMMAAIMQKPELMMFTDQTTLQSLLAPDDAAAVEAALAARGIPLASVAKMKPWMLSAMVALPACEMARKAAGMPVLDVKLAEDAKAAGKELLGLETVTDQLEAMASLPMEFHVRGLVDTLKLGDRMDDVVESMIALYLKGEVGAIWPLFRNVLPDSAEADGYAAFEEVMVTARNRTMALEAEPVLRKGGAFIAIGALHLPGKEGVVELLREAGYTVTPAT